MEDAATSDQKIYSQTIPHASSTVDVFFSMLQEQNKFGAEVSVCMFDVQLISQFLIRIITMLLYLVMMTYMSQYSNQLPLLILKHHKFLAF